MRSTFRLSLAVVLLIAAAGIARAQDSAAPPPAPPDSAVAAAPVSELPAIPFAGPEPAVEPALTVNPSALAVEPVVSAPLDAPAEEVVEKPAAAAVPRLTKKTARKPAVHASESLEPAKPAVNPAAIETTELPPAAAPIAAPAKSVAPPPAAANTVAVDPVEKSESPARMGVGSWFLAGVVVVALFGMITLLRRRNARRETAIPDFTAGQDLKPVLAERH